MTKISYKLTAKNLLLVVVPFLGLIVTFILYSLSAHYVYSKLSGSSIYIAYIILIIFLMNISTLTGIVTSCIVTITAIVDAPNSTKGSFSVTSLVLGLVGIIGYFIIAPIVFILSIWGIAGCPPGATSC